jgi:type IX secretion system PorP/SprF family membrane protein
MLSFNHLMNHFKFLALLMKKILLFSINLLLAATIFAQQENHYTMFMYNKMMYNPAFAGARDVASIWGLYRGQWYGFKGAPTSQLLGFDAPMGKSRVSMGGMFSYHRIGIQRDMIGNLSYSYGIINTAKTSLKFGISGSFRNYAFDFNNPDLYIPDGTVGDESIIAAGASNSFNRGNVGAGLFFAHKDFYLGASIPNIYQSSLVGNNKSVQQRHYYFYAGGLFPLNSRLDLKPALAARYVNNASVSFDTNVSLMFNKKLTVGASYRSDSQINAESISGVAHYQFTKKLSLGVSYDYSLNKLMNFNNGSLETILRYDFGIAKENVNSNFDNPRYFF